MAILTLWLLAVVPALTYPLICWAHFKRLRAKREELDGRAELAAYMGKYAPKQAARYFNWHEYVTPIAFNMVVVTVVCAGLLTGRGWFKGLPPIMANLGPLPPAALAGVAGGYLFGHYDLIRRFRLIDLAPSPMYLLWLRLVVGGVVGYLVGLTMKEPVDLLVALGVGAFPLEEVRDFVTSRARKNLGLSERAAVAERPNLHEIQGCTAEVIDRLREEGIESVQHLAFANPVRLLLRTNLEWAVILDLIDQAILYIYVGDRIGAVRKLNFRGAIDLAEIDEYLASEVAEERDRGNALIVLVATALDVQRPAVERMLASLADDPQLDFVWKLWANLFELGDDSDGQGTTEHLEASRGRAVKGGGVPAAVPPAVVVKVGPAQLDIVSEQQLQQGASAGKPEHATE